MASSSANRRATSIRQLPNDCLYHIFQRLRDSSDRDSFGLTCHRWLHIQNSSRRILKLEWSSNYLSLDYTFRHSIEIDESQLTKLLVRFHRLESLNLAGSTKLQDSALSMLLHHGSNLRTLSLECCYALTDHGVSLISAGCPNLIKISLLGCKITDVGLETLSKSCPGLSHVDISQCEQISDDGITTLFLNCCSIVALNVTSCEGIKGRGFQGCSPSLSYLKAHECYFDEEGLRAIFSMGGLERLNLSNLLRHAKGHQGFPSFEPCFLTKLRILDFSNCKTIGDGAVVGIATSCPLLQEWNLRLCRLVMAGGWRSIGANCGSLELLCTDGCNGLDDEGLDALRDGCPRLRKLFMRSCKRLSWVAVEFFKSSRADVEVIEEKGSSMSPTRPFELEACTL